jgi:SAM-dependent methyltransferase
MDNALSVCRPIELLGRSIKLPRTLALAINALWIARKNKYPGMAFDTTGRKIAILSMMKGNLSHASMLLQPVESIRYWEFDFVSQQLPNEALECLDVSSPRLFSLHTALQLRTTKRIHMINPDPTDIQETQRQIALLRISNIQLENAGVQSLKKEMYLSRFCAIWCISVIEHIDGDLRDSQAISLMYHALKPGGKLILTFPVDRKYRVETSNFSQYGTQPRLNDGSYFFQRFYDEQSIRRRLIDPLGVEPTQIRWFGETIAGWWNRYRADWEQREKSTRVTDPSEMGIGFKEFANWGEMPGIGFCGLVFEKTDG